jgi:hypothetical protein
MLNSFYLKTFYLQEYYIYNSTLAMRPIITWYPEATDYSWKTRVDIYNSDTFIGGFEFQNSYFGYRKRIKSIKKN